MDAARAFAEQIGRWHGFYILAGTAAASSALALALSGGVLFRGDLDDALGLIMLSCVLLIADASRCAWDILVRVGRIGHPGASN